ncbi:MAG: hypothetical protein WD200_00145 [Candidatus Andersenbacteria bacterium]
MNTPELPWHTPPLNDWAIVGMNHYFVNNKKHLFVAMIKDGKCIKAEGADEAQVFQDLVTAALAQS